MRQALTYVLAVAILGLPSYSAERNSWNRIRYVGGTVPVKVSPYDWNTTLTVNRQTPSIVVTIAPASVFTPRRSVPVRPSRVTSLSAGPGAWRRVAEVNGSLMPPKSPALFGLLQDNNFLGILFEADDGKPTSILLDTPFVWQILQALKRVTGKTVEDSP